MIEKQKAKAMTSKQFRAKREISLFSKKNENYESDIGDKTNLDQANDEYSLQL